MCALLLVQNNFLVNYTVLHAFYAFFSVKFFVGWGKDDGVGLVA